MRVHRKNVAMSLAHSGFKILDLTVQNHDHVAKTSHGNLQVLTPRGVRLEEGR